VNNEYDYNDNELLVKGPYEWETLPPSEAIKVIHDLQAENQRLREDQQRLEWLVQQEASVCHVFGMWDVWYSEESRASEHGFGCWREAIDAAMEDSND
jgi:hypothetical protein